MYDETYKILIVIKNVFIQCTYIKKKNKIIFTTIHLPPDSVVRDDQRFIVGDVEYPVTRGADIVVGSSSRDALPQCAISRRKMVNVTVAQRVPGVVFGQPRRISATRTDTVMMVVLHWINRKQNLHY